MNRIDRIPGLPPRPENAHKGTFGRVLIIAGSRGLAGAASLCGRGALHSGAGLVTVAVPRGIAATVAGFHPAYMTLPLVETDGCLHRVTATRLAATAEGQDAVAIGPGLGQTDGVKHVVRSLFASCTRPMVVDADALNILAKDGPELPARAPNAPRILTPHPGEFARLTQLSAGQLEVDRESHAVEFARRHNVILVLKGRHTLITDGKNIAVNQTGNSGMATGGTGDLLTGLIAGLLAGESDPFEAAHLAVHLHGLAGDAAARQYTEPFITAVEVAQGLSEAWRRLIEAD